MAAFQVTAKELRAKAEELRGLKEQFESQVNNLEQQEKSLCSMWEGEAKEAFNKAFNSDIKQMDKFAKLIVQYCASLESIAMQYEKAEAQNVSTATARKYK